MMEVKPAKKPGSGGWQSADAGCTHLPDEQEIQEQLALIRAGWTDAEWESRLVCGHRVPVEFEPTQFRNLG